MKRICIITGGLGNQMFEYAYVLALRANGVKVKLDISYYDFFKMHNGYELEKVFGIKENYINEQGIHMYWLRALNKIRPSILYTFDKSFYDASAITSPKQFIFGYWQDVRYFKGIEELVRKVFTFKDIDEVNKNYSLEMQESHSVSLHIRRGDYAQFGMHIVGEDYYRKTIEKINTLVEHPIYYIFSDDMNVAERMAKSMGLTYKLVSHNRGSNSYKDMFLMSQCKHNIIANSSFSWWGAWLNNNNSKIVIAPQEWDAKTPNFHPQLSNWILI